MTIPPNVVRRIRQLIGVIAQLALVVVTNRAAFVLRFDGQEPAWAMAAWFQMLPWLVAIRGASFAWFRLYQGGWRHTSIYDLIAVVEAILASSVVFAVVASSPFGPPVYPRSVFFIDAILLTVGLSAARIARRLYIEFSVRALGKRLLIIGAGEAGEMLVRDLRAHGIHEYLPIGFIDDDRAKVGRRVHGVPVLGTRADLPRILAAQRPEEVLIAIPSASSALLRSIVSAFEAYKIPIKTLPHATGRPGGRVGLRDIRTLGLEDLLTRPPVGLDRAPLKRLIAGRRVLVTGAGGSIGGELCRQIADMAPASLVLLDRYENGLHTLHLELQDRLTGPRLFQVIADVTDQKRVDAVFERYQPEIVFHAAAHKHVPLMESNPCEAIKNNVGGTRILVEAAERHQADRFIFISTDKAANPINVMGASKRLSELVVRSRKAGGNTTFAIVRFGNVLGSNGSVVPRFLEQIRKGGPVTVTHPEVRRFFMLIPEAVQLVLHAAAQADNMATYVLNMGEQILLADMARHLIRLAGFVPDDEIPIVFTGLRPGEKLSEELVGEGEAVRPSRIDNVMRVMDSDRPSRDTLALIGLAERRAAEGDVAAVDSLLRELLPAFRQAAPIETELESVQRVAVQAEADAKPRMVDRACHVCQVGHLHRARVRTLFERAVRAVGARRIHVCDSCGWRGWLIPLDVAVTVLEATATPDMDGIDAAVASTPFFPGRRGLPRDLQWALDPPPGPSKLRP